MTKLAERMKKEFIDPMPKAFAIFLIIVGIFMGTVFIVGMHYWEAPLSKADTLSVNATFLSYKNIYKRGRINEIIVRFEDHEQLTIDGSCLNDKVINKVEALKPGTSLHLYVHPNSSIILEMVDSDEVIIAFDETIVKLSEEVSSFTVLGIFMYLCAAFGIIKLIRKKYFS